MKNQTDITIILDRSGSMLSICKDTIGGFNSFLAEQRKLPGEARVSLVQFDDQYEVVYAGNDIRTAPELTEATFVPRGSTALLDAIGRTVVAMGARFAAMPEADRPDKVIFVIMTDGGENASREYARAKVFEMVKTQRETFSWEFVFIGANQDSIAVGTSLGIANNANFTADVQGTTDAFANISRGVGSYRSGGGYIP